MFLAVLCLAAAAAAEADPYILGYGGYGGNAVYGGYGLGYSGLQGLGFAGYGGYGGYGYASPVHHGYNHAANTQVSPSASLSIAGAAPAAVPGVVGARTYAGAGRYVANSAGTVHVAKREADPYYAGYNGIGFAGQGYTGYRGYGLGYAGYGGYATPVVHAATPVNNVAAVHSGIPIHSVAGVDAASPFYHGYGNAANTQVSPSASLSIAGAAPAAVPGVVGARTYAGADRYVANSAGTVHVAKREADPYYAGYNGLGYAGYGGYGHGYSGLQGVGYAGYGGYGT